MNHDSITDAGRRVARTNERGEHSATRRTAERIRSFTVRLLIALAVVLAVTWAGAVVVPAFSGMFAATVVGLGALWLVPWLVVTGVVRTLEATG